MKEKVISCKLSSSELQKYKSRVIARLKNSIIKREELANGYQYFLEGSDTMIDDIISFIKTERACCNFFTFNLSIEDHKTSVVLSITGPKGAKEFIKVEMDL